MKSCEGRTERQGLYNGIVRAEKSERDFEKEL